VTLVTVIIDGEAGYPVWMLAEGIIERQDAADIRAGLSVEPVPEGHATTEKLRLQAVSEGLAGSGQTILQGREMVVADKSMD
jgi:hypothetical protein